MLFGSFKLNPLPARLHLPPQSTFPSILIGANFVHLHVHQSMTHGEDTAAWHCLPPTLLGQPSGCHQPPVLIESFVPCYTSLFCLLGHCIAMMLQCLQVLLRAYKMLTAVVS